MPQGSQLQDLPAYKTWHAGAEKLLEQATAITSNPKTYGACLNHTRQAWTKVHDSIRDLQRQLGHDTTSLRHQQPDLHLPPIVRGVPTLDEARQGDATYRRLRNDWNQHMAHAETNNAHPYEIKGYAAMIETALQLSNQPHLDTTARNALAPILTEHAHVEEARTHIDTYLNDTQETFTSLANLKKVAQEFEKLDVAMERMSAYTEWRERALNFTAEGKQILADQKLYRIHLKQNPELTAHIHATVRDLNTALHSEKASIQPQEQRKAAQQELTTRTTRSVKP